MPPSAYAPMRVKCSHRWSRAICSSSCMAGMFPVAVIDLSLRLCSCGGGGRFSNYDLCKRCASLAPLNHEVREHQHDGEEEDHRADHVDLRRHRHSCCAPDEERERSLRTRVEVGDHEVVDRQ